MDNVATIDKATRFAARKHRNGVRKDELKTPYIVHPIGVMMIIREVGKTTALDILCAAILHDIIEDTLKNAKDSKEIKKVYDEIMNEFSKATADYVMELTDDQSLKKYEKKAAQIIKAKYFSFGAGIIKIADKIYNCSDNPNWSQERKTEYVQFSIDVINNIPVPKDNLEFKQFKLVYNAFQTLVKKTNVTFERPLNIL